MIRKVYMYKKFERIWHWSQALLIFFLALTGFEVHGSYVLFGFERAVVWHMYAGWVLIVLIAFAIFWHFTTGEWRQYIPKTDRLRDQVWYYLVGIFRNEPHPVEKTVEVKLNPLQRLTYLGFKVVVVPIMVTTGLIYYYVAHGEIYLRTVKWIAIWHTLGGFILLAFAVIHVYMTTTGPRGRRTSRP
jgi:thiosulfate reductase cytochrome b subunit